MGLISSVVFVGLNLSSIAFEIYVISVTLVILVTYVILMILVTVASVIPSADVTVFFGSSFKSKI